jgi:hypothetical protein
MPTPKTPPTVTVEHWIAKRGASPEVIERWSITIERRTLLTFESEIQARAACREHGWIVAETVDLGWVTPKP